MCDQSIFPRALMRQRGADAFDQGRGVDDHHMNPGAPAIAEWQAGWRERQAVVFAREVVCQQVVKVGPP